MHENLTRKATNKWLVQFKYVDQLTGRMKRHRKTINGTLEEAKRYRDETKIALRQGCQNQGELKLGAHVTSFVISRAGNDRRGREVRNATLKRDVAALDNHILPVVQDWRMDQVQRRDVERLMDLWLKKRKPDGELYSAATVNTWLKVFKIYARWSWEQAGLGKSPVEDVADIQERRSKSGRALSADELGKLIEAVGEHYPQHFAMLMVAVSTGARISEVTALEWGDLEDGMIRFRRHQVDGHVYDGTKTGKEVRAVLLDEVKDALQAHRVTLVGKQAAGLADGLIFPDAVGGYRQRSATHKWMRLACAKAGIEQCSFHDLRRTFNTMLLASGANHILVQALTGHSTDAMTVHYSHVSDDDRRAVVVPIRNALKGKGG